MQLQSIDPLVLISEKLTSWTEVITLSLPNLVAAIVVLVIFYYGARILRRPVETFAQRISKNQTIQGLITLAIQVFIYGLALLLALQIMHLDKAVTSLLAGVGIVGIALGFAFQDIAANFISGILIAFTAPYDVNDIVETNGYFGKITHINLRNTIIHTPDGKHVVIPNKEIFLNPLVNYTETPLVRVEVACGVSYSDNLEVVRRTAVKALGKLPFVNADKGVELFYTEFGDSSINFVIRFWIEFSRQADSLHAGSEAIMALKKAFDKKGITIPFPIRTVEFMGGEVDIKKKK